MTKQIDVLTTETTPNLAGNTNKSEVKIGLSLFDKLLGNTTEKSSVPLDKKTEEVKVIAQKDSTSLNTKVVPSETVKKEVGKNTDETLKNSVDNLKKEFIPTEIKEVKTISGKPEQLANKQVSLLDRLVMEAKNIVPSKKEEVSSLSIPKQPSENKQEVTNPNAAVKLPTENKSEVTNINTTVNSPTENKSEVTNINYPIKNKQESITPVLNTNNKNIDTSLDTDINTNKKDSLDKNVLESSTKNFENSEKVDSKINDTKSNDKVLNTIQNTETVDTKEVLEKVMQNSLDKTTNNIEKESLNIKSAVVNNLNQDTKTNFSVNTSTSTPNDAVSTLLVKEAVINTNSTKIDNNIVKVEEETLLSTKPLLKEDNSEVITNKTIIKDTNTVESTDKSVLLNTTEKKEIPVLKNKNTENIISKSTKPNVEEKITSPSPVSSTIEVKSQKVASELSKLSTETIPTKVDITKSQLDSLPNKENTNKSLMDQLLQSNMKTNQEITKVSDIDLNQKNTLAQSKDLIGNIYLSSQKNSITNNELSNKKNAIDSVKNASSLKDIETSASKLNLNVNDINVETKVEQRKKDDISLLDRKSTLDKLVLNNNTMKHENSTIITKSMEVSKVTSEDNKKTITEISLNVSPSLAQSIQSRIIGARQSMSNMMSEVAKRMYENYKPPVTAFRINLTPGNLGSIAIVMKSDKENGLTISLNLSNSATLDAFVDNENSLKNALSKTFEDESKFTLDFNSNDNNSDDKNNEEEAEQNNGNTKSILESREKNIEAEDSNNDYM
jgi:hypothetical protein